MDQVPTPSRLMQQIGQGVMNRMRVTDEHNESPSDPVDLPRDPPNEEEQRRTLDQEEEEEEEFSQVMNQSYQESLRSSDDVVSRAGHSSFSVLDPADWKKPPPLVAKLSSRLKKRLERRDKRKGGRSQG